MAMALTSSISFKLPVTNPLPVRVTPSNTSLQLLKPPPPVVMWTTTNTIIRSRNRNLVRKAVEEGSKEKESTESDAAAANKSSSDSDLGAEIKKAMAERQKEDDGLLSGVAEEVQQIEWPAFGKVLGTTGVVLGVIAGSSVVLLTVNVVLAELSDRVFAGRGLQDFFG